MMGVVLAWSMLPWPVRVGSSVGAQVGVRQIVKTIESAHVWSQAHPRLSKEMLKLRNADNAQ